MELHSHKMRDKRVVELENVEKIVLSTKNPFDVYKTSKKIYDTKLPKEFRCRVVNLLAGSEDWSCEKDCTLEVCPRSLFNMYRIRDKAKIYLENVLHVVSEDFLDK